MEIQKLSDDWLFQRHSEEQIKKWVQNLEYSYFNRAWGGQANDGDYFSLRLNYNDKNELLDTLKRLGIKLNIIPKEQPRPIQGKSYTHEEYLILKDEIKDFPEYEQPGHFEIQGIKCYCWIEKGEINFSFRGNNGDPYEVSERDFENCKRIEMLIKSNGLAHKVSRKYEDSVTCISKKKYSSLFK